MAAVVTRAFKPFRAIGDRSSMAHTRPVPSPELSPAGRARPARRFPRAFIAALGLALLVALSTTTGCMVMDELDSAAAKMPTSAKEKAEAAAKKDAAKAGPSGAAGRVAASKAAVMAASRQWWKQAKTINTGEAPAGVVSCKLPEGMKFMSKDDCVTQGGKPGDAS